MTSSSNLLASASSVLLQQHFPDTWLQAEQLLPSFLNKTCAKDDQVWMEQWINQVNSAGELQASALQQEMDFVEMTQNYLATSQPEMNLTAGWQQLSRQLSATYPPKFLMKNGLFHAAVRFLQQKVDVAVQWWQNPLVGVFAAVMIVGQMGLLVATVKDFHQTSEHFTTVIPANGATAPQVGASFKIVFKPSAQIQQIIALAQSLGGQITQGPSALGLLTITVPVEQKEHSLKRLSASPLVESVVNEE